MKRVPFFDNPVLRGQLPTWRARLVLILLFGGFTVLAGRALFLQGLSTEFLQQQGERRYERTLTLSATRGKIMDRNGAVLASSVPARAIWAIPEDVKQSTPAQLDALAKLLEMPAADLRHRVDEDKNFVYLKRQVSMEAADKIKQLGLPGVHQQPETRRYYPDGDVMAHVVGFNSVEDQGQEGVELTFNQQLSGRPGSRRVIKDRLGRVIEDVQAVTLPVDGRDLRLSIDTRLQYLVFKELKDAMDKHQAKGATAVVLDVHTGEILALANVPTFDPNKRETFQGAKLRNQAITDTFEPGSIMKPFTAALALDLGRITPNTLFETGNGRFVYQGSTISDVSRNGTLDVAGVLRKSSNIGMTLISESWNPRDVEPLHGTGPGAGPQVGFPARRPDACVLGALAPDREATMAYGYGLSVSLLQVARAYTVFARNGDMVSMTLVKRDSDPTSVRIYAQDHRAGARHAEAAAGPRAPRPRKCAATAWRARAARRARSSTASTACSATAVPMSVSRRCPIPRSSWPCPSMSRRSAAITAALSPRLCSPALSAGVCSYGGASRRALRIHDCCWFEGARQMNAKGFQSNSQAATVEQTVAWLHERVSLTAHLKLDSREIEPGDVFVACAGLSSDGRFYIERAVAQGARAVLCEAPVDDAMLAQAGQVPLLQVTGLRGLLGGLGDTWYDRPSAELAVVAVTGTNGKTSSVQWIAHALSRNDKACGTIGTLGRCCPTVRHWVAA